MNIISLIVEFFLGIWRFMQSLFGSAVKPAPDTAASSMLPYPYKGEEKRPEPAKMARPVLSTPGKNPVSDLQKSEVARSALIESVTANSANGVCNRISSAGGIAELIRPPPDVTVKPKDISEHFGTSQQLRAFEDQKNPQRNELRNIGQQMIFGSSK